VTGIAGPFPSRLPRRVVIRNRARPARLAHACINGIREEHVLRLVAFLKGIAFDRYADGFGCFLGAEGERAALRDVIAGDPNRDRQCGGFLCGMARDFLQPFGDMFGDDVKTKFKDYVMDRTGLRDYISREANAQAQMVQSLAQTCASANVTISNANVTMNGGSGYDQLSGAASVVGNFLGSLGALLDVAFGTGNGVVPGQVLRLDNR
jgi:hypothetical protein